MSRFGLLTATGLSSTSASASLSSTRGAALLRRGRATDGSGRRARDPAARPVRQLPVSLRSDLLRVGPYDGAHRVAVRAGLSVAVPLLVLFATDRLAWSAYAAFGAFAAL